MKQTDDTAPDVGASGDGRSAGSSVRVPWIRPRLVRMGSVAQLTAKKDNIGRNDGGSGTKKRT